MIKCVLTFVSGVQESVLVNVISQNKIKILHEVKILQSQNLSKLSLSKISLQKRTNIYFLNIFFEFLSCY